MNYLLYHNTIINSMIELANITVDIIVNLIFKLVIALYCNVYRYNWVHFQAQILINSISELVVLIDCSRYNVIECNS